VTPWAPRRRPAGASGGQEPRVAARRDRSRSVGVGPAFIR
jgi:hypothetical protein